MKTVLRGAISLAILGFLVSQVQLGELLGVLSDARIDLLALLALTFVVDRVLAAYRWYILIVGAGHRACFSHLLRLVFVGSFLGYFIPGGLGVDAFRAYGFAQTSSDIGLAVTTVVVDRAFGILALIVLVLAGLALQPTGIPAAVGSLAWLGLGVLVVGTFLVMHPRLRELTSLLLTARWLGPLRHGLGGIYRRLDHYRQRPGLMLWSFLVAIGVQVLRCVGPAIGAAALGMPLPLVLFIVIMPVIVFITLLPISVAGLGVQDMGFVYLFGLQGMPAEIALLLSVIIHAFVFLSALPGAWFYLRRGLAQ